MAEENKDMIPIQVVKWASIPDFAILDKAIKFNDFCDEIKIMAQGIMNKLTHLPPVVFFVMDNGDVCMWEIGIFINSTEGKDFAAAYIRDIVKNKHDPIVYGIVMVSEAWLANLAMSDKATLEEVQSGRKSVSELDNSEEVIVLNIQTKESMKVVKIPVVRVDDTMVTLGIPEEMPDAYSHDKQRFSFF